jgi:hypothetical protein
MKRSVDEDDLLATFSGGPHLHDSRTCGRQVHPGHQPRWGKIDASRPADLRN